MFNFARYFFAVFIITTIIPLVLMFSWNHYHMSKVMDQNNSHFIDFETEKLRRSTKHYLKIRQGYVLENVLNFHDEDLSVEKIQERFNTGSVELITDEDINKVESYYKATGSELYNIVTVPLKNKNIKGIKYTEKVQLEELHPSGPFDIEIYLVNKTDKRSLLKTVENPMKPLHRPPMDLLEKIDKREIAITDNKNNTVAILVLNFKPMHMMPPPGGARPDMHKPPGPTMRPPESEFGLIILFAGFVLTLSIGFYLNKNFINPLIILSKALKQVQNGDLAFELNTKIKQEQIQDIFKNFNHMLKGLREKDSLRKSFVTSLTHDLKTPLIAQARSLGLISGEFKELGINKAYELSRGLEKNTQHLLRMVDLILESYRFELNKLNLNISGVNLSKFIDGCYQDLNSLAEEKNIKLTNNIPNDITDIKADSTCLKRIFMNLISNSIDNTHNSGQIETNAEICKDTIKISVKDNGTGIAQEDLAHIFDRYYTGKSDDRKIGSGLGLYVCKKLIELHNGKISVNSEVNKYTEFIIELPLNLKITEE